MKIFAVRIGEKYGPEYEKYLKDKLSDYDLNFIREPINSKILLQWNKIYGMGLDIDEPVCFIDIDILLVNDYKKIFDYPIKKGQFLAMPGWWREDQSYKINGGFFKYYPKDCKYIYDKFMKDIDYWQTYYIKNGTTKGPVNGEQHFVEDSVKEKLELITLPNSWVTRWCANSDVIGGKNIEEWQFNTTLKYNQLTNNDYLYMGGKFNDDIKLVHFTNAVNKPHKWKDYDNFTKKEKNIFYVSDYKNSDDALANDMYKNGAFKDVNRKKVLSNLSFYEFTLEELGLPSADYILQGVKNIEKEVGLQGWKVKNFESKKYKGFSLTYNPDFFDKKTSKYHQTMGHSNCTQSYSGWLNKGEHKNPKNTYYDTYSFRHIHDLIYNNLKDLFDRLTMPVLRSRVAYQWPKDEINPFAGGWHIDEYPTDMMRINIPVQTVKGHELHIEGKDHYGNEYSAKKHLEVGKVYLWNTNIPHTIGAKLGTDSSIPRINLVIGVSPYFDYDKEKDCFIKNHLYGKNINDIIVNKLFVKPLQ